MPDKLSYIEQHWPMLSTAIGSIGVVLGIGYKQKHKLDQVHAAVPDDVMKGKAHLQTDSDVKSCQSAVLTQIEVMHKEQKTDTAELHSRVDEVHVRVDDIYKLLVEKLP